MSNGLYPQNIFNRLTNNVCHAFTAILRISTVHENPLGVSSNFVMLTLQHSIERKVSTLEITLGGAAATKDELTEA